MREPMLIHCASCGTTNRVPAAKLKAGATAICGNCKAPLTGTPESASPAPITVTDQNFADEVERSPLPVLVDMWAPWCGPCRQIAPVVEALAAELSGRLKVGKLNVDENPVTAERFRILSIPALLMFKEGREIDRIIGAQSSSSILRRVQQLLA